MELPALFDLPAVCEQCSKPPIAGCDHGAIYCRPDGTLCTVKEYPRMAEMCPRVREMSAARAIAADQFWIEKLWPMPGRYAGARFKLPHEADATLGVAYGYAERLIPHIASGNEPRGYGFVVFGGNGLGKSYLAAAVVNQARAAGLTAIFTEETAFLNRLKASFDKRHADESDATCDDILTAARECDLLVLDDAGKANQTEWAREIIWSVFNERYNEMRSSVVTTNLDSKQLARNEQWKAIISRLVESGKSLELTGKSLR